VLSFEQLRDAIRAALTARACSCSAAGISYCNHVTPCPCCIGGECHCSSCCSIVATFEDSVVVSHRDATLTQIPVTVDKAGRVTLGEPKPVQLVYQAITEALAGLGGLLGPIEVVEGATKGKEWACVLIQEGKSANKRIYPAKVLREAAPLFEGAPVYFTHAASGKAEPDPRDLAGFIRGARAALIESTGKTAILGNFRSTSSRASELLTEAFEAGNPGLVGLSIRAGGKSQKVMLAEGVADRVESIDTVASVDMVMRPAAGGKFISLVAGMPSDPVSDKEFQMLQQLIENLKKVRPDLHAKLSATPTETEVATLLTEAMAQAPVAAPPVTAPAPPPAAAAAPAGDVISFQEARELRGLAHTFRVDSALAGRTMADPLKAKLRESLLSRVGLSEAEIKVEVDRFVEVSAAMTAPATAGTGLAKPITEGVTSDAADKYAEALEGMFFEGSSAAVIAEFEKEFGRKPATRGFRSLKASYVEATGDPDVTGLLERKNVSRYSNLVEGVLSKFEEAIGTSTLSNAYAATMNRRLQMEYRAGDNQRWRRVVSTVKPLSDFRNQESIRMGHLADLAVVSQSGTYPEFTDPTDEKVTYAPSKRGAIISITREAIKNDDIGVVRRIPVLAAMAAGRTLNKFIFDLIAANPTLDDSVALFAAATTRGTTSDGNLQTAALSETTIGIARQRLLKVMDKDNRTNLGLSPKILIVPPELEKDAIRFTTLQNIPIAAQTSTEANYVAQKYGLNEYIVLEHLTDANNYFIVADPRLIETIEVGFVDGQEEPVILVQDQELVGAVFTADKWSFKVRHEWGADVVEWRGFQGGIVA
jgi:hypothetical protein